ncbi:glycosyltransferase family 4 protein [Paenirhodobacter populi]|nr:glycosyltransferase family 4 protein [Sinirhodobacter populi]
MNIQRCLLVLPDGAVNRRMGSGQRSALVFEALKRIAPTDVVVLGKTEGEVPVAPDQALETAFFPGAASLRRVRSSHFRMGRRHGVDWVVHNLNRFLRVDRLYAAEPQVCAALAGILTPEHGVVAFRYSQPYCLSDVVAGPGRRVFVDIDDRDDQKFETAARATLGTGLMGRVFSRFVVPRIRQILTDKLGRASLLWYATGEDILPIPDVPARVLRNVPFGEAGEDTPDPAGSRDILFVGTYSHRPNQDGVRWFLRHCWPEIQRRNPDARFRLVGMGDWKALAAEFPDLPNVDYVGTVDELAPEYARARFAISPVFDGGGSKIKVIETCAYRRLPVVSVHSARGFGDALFEALPKADDPAGFIDLCDLYLRDDAALHAATDRLRALQQAQFSRRSAEQQIEDDIRSALG